LGVAVVLMSLLLASGEVLRRQVARDVGVALFQQQALGGGFLDVAVDHPRHLGLGAPVVVVALQRHDFVGAPLAQFQGPEPA
jgi:hypothetical protein